MTMHVTDVGRTFNDVVPTCDARVEHTSMSVESNDRPGKGTSERLLVQMVATGNNDACRIAAELRLAEDHDLASGFPAGTRIWTGTVSAEPRDISYVLYARSTAPTAPELRTIP